MFSGEKILFSSFASDHPSFKKARALAAKEQPRQAIDRRNRCTLPYAEPVRQQQSLLLERLPVDCRLLILDHVLRKPQTRIERWRPPCDSLLENFDHLDVDCFPYRMTTSRAEKTDTPVNLLLCCRQLYLEGLPLLYSTTMVFESISDLRSFQLCASPEGLSKTRSLIIAIGHINVYQSDIYFKDTAADFQRSLDRWRDVICGFGSMKCLKELRIYLGHRHVNRPESERRPWKEENGSRTFEERHQKVFELFGTATVPKFTLHLTWSPEDVLTQRQWPFKVHLQTKDEIVHLIDHVLPLKTEYDLYDWKSS